jgi:hypothetical protein
MHKYTVDLMISAAELDADEISGLLKLRPSTFFRKGELLSNKTQSRRDCSSFSVHFDPPHGGEWDSLEDGLSFMLDCIGPLQNELLQLGERFSCEAYCGHFGSGFGGGPSISPKTLQRLSSLGLGITIKAYWGSSEPDA